MMTDAESTGSSFAARMAFSTCAVGALACVWGHHFPAGVDLPQHANLFHVWASMGDPNAGYAFFYEVLFFTPYLLTYAVALPLTMIGGPLFAIKVLLSATVLLTPWQMRRWLVIIRGEPWWALWGFVLALGFGYLWGFLSWMLSFPLAFAYLADLEGLRRGRDEVGSRLVVLTLLLFFTHALTFAVCGAIGGLVSVTEIRRPREMARQIAHLIPATVLAGAWALRENRPRVPHALEWPPSPDRVVSLFAGAFAPRGEYLWAIVGLGVLATTFVLARPLLVRAPSRWLPLALSVIGFAALPEMVRGTWLVGTRFLAFIHAFAPGAFQPTGGRAAQRRLRFGTLAMVLLALVALNVRLARFNAEISGLGDLIAEVKPGSDVSGLLADTDPDSEALGRAQFYHAMAWIPAERGGFLENDSGRYYQIPVQRRLDVTWPSHPRYFIARGDVERASALAGERANAPVRLAKQSGSWLLFEVERPTLHTGDLTVVRYGEQGGELRVDRSTDGQFVIGGRAYETGLGARGRSSIEVRPMHGGGALVGEVGLADGALQSARAEFQVFGSGRTLLWSSGPVTTGSPATPFRVPLPPGPPDDLLLVTRALDSRGFGDADWVDLRVTR
jgi:hypothetical protein